MNRHNASTAGYDRLANHYQLLENVLFGAKLQRSRVAMLPTLPACQSALVLGDGDGRLLEAFCQSQPECCVTSVDQSERMLAMQNQRIALSTSLDRVTFVRQDARAYHPEPNSIDLLVTSYFLDCFTFDDLSCCLPAWIGGLKDQGWLYVVDFQQPPDGWQRFRGKLLLSLMHWFFRWQTKLPNRHLVDIDSVLQRQPLKLVKQIVFDQGLIRAQLYQVSREASITETEVCCKHAL